MDDVHVVGSPVSIPSPTRKWRGAHSRASPNAYANRYGNSNFLLQVSALSLTDMNVFTIELSSPTAGVALLGEDEPLVQTWHQPDEARQHLFTVLREHFPGALLSRVDRLVVGLGPGSFSGVRSAIACATGLALPAGRPVEGIPSIEAIASDAARETQAERIVVVGDARRNRYWLASYIGEGERLETELACALYTPEEIVQQLKPGSAIVSPDWARVGDFLQQIASDDHQLIREPRMPDPFTLGRIALDRIQRGEPLSAPEPMYLHPPVFVEPKFPPST